MAGDAAQDETHKLRRALSDMAALSSLPALWLKADERRIAEVLAEAVLRVLDVQAVRVDLLWEDQEPLVIRASSPRAGEALRQALDLRASMGPVAGSGGDVLATPGGRAFCTGIGIAGSRICAAAARADFPTEAERLTLAMAANQAAVALERERAERALRAQTESLNRERDSVAALNRTLANERDKLRQMFEQAPGFIAVLRGPDHVFELCNASYVALAGEREFIGRSVREVFPDLEGQGFFELLDEAYASGRPYVGAATPVDLQRTPGGPMERRYLNFLYQPIFDEHGQVTGIFAQGHDVTRETVAAEHRQLLVNELNHRVKNTLATVQAITYQTLCGFSGLGEVEALLTNRLIALSKAHDVLTRENWAGADLMEIVAETLGAHDTPQNPRIRIQGPHARLEPGVALALSMALHELATNAAKYGALSRATGEVSLSWSIDRGGDVVLDWIETGGPPILSPPKRRGFGSRLLRSAVAAELGSPAVISYSPTGMRCRMRWPAAEAAKGGVRDEQLMDGV